MHAYLVKFVYALGLYPLARRFRMWMDHHSPGAVKRRQALCRFYSKFVKDGDLCFDVGANVGDRTEMLLSLGASVVCVEPQADCVKVMRRRFRRNPKVAIVEKALGASEGTADLHVCEYNPGITSLSTKWISQSRYAAEYGWNRTVQVPVTTLDALIAQYGTPAFCKIDVEGFEDSVLAGLSQPVGCLSFEFRHEMLEEAFQCLHRAAALGPAQCNCTVFDAVETLYPDWSCAPELRQNLKALSDPLLWGDIYVRFDGRASPA